MRITLNGTYIKAIKVSGFLSRMFTKKGKKIIKNRRKKGRYSLCISKHK